MFRRLLIVLVAALTLLPVQPALAGPSPTTVLFVGGYGGSLTSAVGDFSALRSALLQHDPQLRFAQYSYTGWDADACRPLDYRDADTGQDFATSEQRLLNTVLTLRAQCGAQRIVVIGHSLGGLVALHALSDSPMAEVSDIITVDSPLGGAPAEEIQACIEYGLCVDGPVGSLLSRLNGDWDQTAVDNASRVSHLAQLGTRVTAWGNQSDCLYAPAACLPAAKAFLGPYDVRETQWLGVDRAMRRDYVPSTLASILHSHDVMLTRAAGEIANELFA
jgi:pimeloyl-ACP methyl ester carboxylesterase